MLWSLQEFQIMRNSYNCCPKHLFRNKSSSGIPEKEKKMSSTINSDNRTIVQNTKILKRTKRVYLRHMIFIDSIEKYFHNTFY